MRVKAVLFGIGCFATASATTVVANASVVSTTCVGVGGGSCTLHIISAPAHVGNDFLVNQGLPAHVIFDEMQNVTLSNPLVTDTGIIAAGTRVDSEFYAVNSVNGGTVNTTATFSGKVLGVVYQDASLALFAASDFLGAPGTTYTESTCSACGFEAGIDKINFILGDTVGFHNSFGEPGDFARVIVAATPLPATLPLLASGLGVMGYFARRKKRKATGAVVAAR